MGSDYSGGIITYMTSVGLKPTSFLAGHSRNIFWHSSHRPYTLNTGRVLMASSDTISASANKIFKKSKAGWIFKAVGNGSISLVRPQQIIARNSMGVGGGRVWVLGSHFVRYVKIPNSLLLTRSELPVVKHRSSAGSSLLNSVKHHEAGYGKQWCENMRYIHSHCSWDSLSMRTPSVKTKTPFSPSRAVPICPPHNNGNRTPTRCGGNTRPSPTRGEALHALAWPRKCARWSVATAPAQRSRTITKYNDKALAARCARGVEGKGERLVPTYLGQCWCLGGWNNNISPRCVRSPSTTP